MPPRSIYASRSKRPNKSVYAYDQKLDGTKASIGMVSSYRGSMQFYIWKELADMPSQAVATAGQASIVVSRAAGRDV
jgi:hypothetical protein